MKAMISSDPWVWLSAIFTIACLTFLYKDNPFWRFVENTVIGITTGNMVVMAIANINKIGIGPISTGSFSLILPILVGFLFFSRYLKQYSWLNRYAVAILLGIGTGISVRMVPKSQLIAQIQSTMVPIITSDPFATLGNIVLVVLVIGGIINFVFTKKLENPVTNSLREIGRNGLFVTFGALYAAIVLTYMSALIGQVQFLLFDWLGLG